MALNGALAAGSAFLIGWGLEQAFDLDDETDAGAE